MIYRYLACAYLVYLLREAGAGVHDDGPQVGGAGDAADVPVDH